MGIKSKPVADPALARDHKAGASVIIVQQAEHTQLGTISYEVRMLWQLHIAMAFQGFEFLLSVHEQIARVPIDTANSRTLVARSDPDLAAMAYGAGVQMVLNVVLTMQHFCEEVERRLGAEQDRTGTVGERIKRVFGLAGLAIDTQGYSAFQEMVERRDAIEHPKRESVRNSHATDWDKVPIGWLLTERAPRAFERWEIWFRSAVEQWKRHPAMQPRPGTLTVTRGIRSDRQAKKPPRESLRQASAEDG